MSTSNPYEPRSESHFKGSAGRTRWRIIPTALFSFLALVGGVYSIIILAFVAYAAIDGQAPDGWWAGRGAKLLNGGLVGLVQAALLAFSSLQIWKRNYLIAIGLIIGAIALRMAIARIV